MNSLTDVWATVMEKLAGELTPTALNTWFSDCVPVKLDDKRLVLQTSTDFKRNIISSRFGETIKNTMSDLFSCDFNLLVLVGDEVKEYAGSSEQDDLPEASAYTFDRFIVGASNKFAHAAAMGVAENPGKVYNPLFIYGPSGLGKTHLLLAIARYIREHNPSVTIGYVKGDDFTNQMVASLREGTQAEFRKKYRNVDLFLVDDIQFIAGKIGVQEEFFHTFNNIYEAGHQIVITSDRPPLDMVKLEDRLRTRFEGGLMADIGKPDLELRMAIVRDKGQSLGLSLSDEVVEYIAQNITENVRQLEGVVNRLTAYRELMDDSVTVSSVNRAIKDVVRVGMYIPTPEVIINETGRYYGLDVDDIRGQRRSKDTAMARQVAMYLIRKLTNLSLEDIGKEFDSRNHSTVLSSIRKVEELVKSDKEITNSVRDITSNINARG